MKGRETGGRILDIYGMRLTSTNVNAGLLECGASDHLALATNNGKEYKVDFCLNLSRYRLATLPLNLAGFPGNAYFAPALMG